MISLILEHQTQCQSTALTESYPKTQLSRAECHGIIDFRNVYPPLTAQEAKRIEEERAAAVGPEALNLGLQAMRASAEAALLKKNAAKQAKV